MQNIVTDTGADCAQTATSAENPKIVILDRGFVLVGNVTIDGDWVTTTNASIIRRWGTTKGLGELASNGPLESTKLDPIGTVKSPLRALIGLVSCEPSKWTL